MFLRQLFDKDSSTYSYLIADPDAKQAALIDPVDSQVERDLCLVRELGFELAYVLETHVHADHVTGAGELKRRTSARSCASAAGAPCIDVKLRHGDKLRLGALEIQVLGTPGHTDDSLSFLVDGHVFTGDALLVRGNGRTDFQNGDAAALYDSITQVLFALPDATVVLPGHDYKGLPSSTIGEEKAHNPRLAGKTRAEFVSIMDGLGLPPPKRLDVAVPANRACGRVDGLS
jgi:sulfur dioxygenase